MQGLGESHIARLTSCRHYLSNRLPRHPRHNYAFTSTPGSKAEPSLLIPYGSIERRGGAATRTRAECFALFQAPGSSTTKRLKAQVEVVRALDALSPRIVGPLNCGLVTYSRQILEVIAHSPDPDYTIMTMMQLVNYYYLCYFLFLPACIRQSFPTVLIVIRPSSMSLLRDLPPFRTS